MANADKTKQFIAVILDKAIKNFDLQDCQRLLVEKAVKDAGCGNTSDCRYFLKEGVKVKSIMGITKNQTRKARCCTILKDVLDSDMLSRIYSGIVNVFRLVYIHALVILQL